MKETLVQNKFYEISIDKEKNRAFIKIIGFWRNKGEVPSYLQDLNKTLTGLKDNFTLLTDLSEMKTHPAELQELHMEAQQLLISKGLSQTAEVYNNIIVQFQTDTISKKSKMPLRQFSNKEDAEIYLDSLSIELVS